MSRLPFRRPSFSLSRYIYRALSLSLPPPPTSPREPVWPSGKVGKQKDLDSNPLRLSFVFKHCGCRHCLVCDFVPHNQRNIKMALIAAHLNAGVILVVTVQLYIYNHPLPPPPYPLPHISPSLLSLMVSVDVKHHVYLPFLPPPPPTPLSFPLWLKCCFTSTETIGLLGTGAQDVHLHFHTVPEL